MKTWQLGIALLGGAALLSVPALASADEAATDSSGGLFSTSVLSRFLPSAGSQEDAPPRQSLPTRFSLGFFTTGQTARADTALEEDFLASSYLQDGQPTQITALANFGYGSYYGVSRLDTTSLYLLPGLAGLDELPRSSEVPRDESLALSLEAGVRHHDLNTGVLYAYQSGYPALHRPHGATALPSYIFTPLGPLTEQNRDQRGPNGHAVFLYLGYNHSPQLNLRGSVGLAKTGINSSDSETGHLLSEQSRRWGIDIAATYKLLDNLVYHAHLGYVSIDETPSTADAPTLHTGSDATPQSAGGQGPDSIFHIGSHIRMTF